MWESAPVSEAVGAGVVVGGGASSEQATVPKKDSIGRNAMLGTILLINVLALFGGRDDARIKDLVPREGLEPTHPVR